MLSYCEHPESLSLLDLVRYRDETDRQTDGQNYDSTRLALLLSVLGRASSNNTDQNIPTAI